MRSQPAREVVGVAVASVVVLGVALERHAADDDLGEDEGIQHRQHGVGHDGADEGVDLAEDPDNVRVFGHKAALLLSIDALGALDAHRPQAHGVDDHGHQREYGAHAARTLGVIVCVGARRVPHGDISIDLQAHQVPDRQEVGEKIHVPHHLTYTRRTDGVVSVSGLHPDEEEGEHEAYVGHGQTRQVGRHRKTPDVTHPEDDEGHKVGQQPEGDDHGDVVEVQSVHQVVEGPQLRVLPPVEGLSPVVGQCQTGDVAGDVVRRHRHHRRPWRRKLRRLRRLRHLATSASAAHTTPADDATAAHVGPYHVDRDVAVGRLRILHCVGRGVQLVQQWHGGGRIHDGGVSDIDQLLQHGGRCHCLLLLLLLPLRPPGPCSSRGPGDDGPGGTCSDPAGRVSQRASSASHTAPRYRPAARCFEPGDEWWCRERAAAFRAAASVHRNISCQRIQRANISQLQMKR